MIRLGVKWGVDILKDGDLYYIRFDKGGHEMEVAEIPITVDEANELLALETWEELTAYTARFKGNRLNNARIVPPSEWPYDEVLDDGPVLSSPPSPSSP